MENSPFTRADDMWENKTNQKEEKHSHTDGAWFLVGEAVEEWKSIIYNC